MQPSPEAAVEVVETENRVHLSARLLADAVPAAISLAGRLSLAQSVANEPWGFRERLNAMIALFALAASLLGAFSFSAAAQDRAAQRNRDDGAARQFYRQQYLQNQYQSYQRPFDSPFSDGRQQRSVPPSRDSTTVPNR